MNTTTPTFLAPTTTVDPQERARELLLQEPVGVENLLDGASARRPRALRSLLNRSSPEVTREVLEPPPRTSWPSRWPGSSPSPRTSASSPRAG
jgi:hypothetical protein